MNAIYRSASTWMIGLAVLTGFVATLFEQPLIGIVAPIAVLFLCLILLKKGLSSYRKDASPAEYFGANSDLPAVTTLQSLGSSWIMLGNVIVAGMILGQAFGAATIWMILTWFYAFILMSRRVRKVRGSLTATGTLHTYLHDAYNSMAMRRVAACVTIIVGVGVFAIELIAGLALLAAALPSIHAATVSVILIMLLLVAMCVAGAVGGLRAVITTDAMLWKIVIAGVALMLVFSVILYSGRPLSAPSISLLPEGIGIWEVGAFLIGVTALQVPLLLADYGTWQRIKATDEDDVDPLRKKMVILGGAQGILWLIPVVAGFALIGLAPIYDDQASPLYRSSGPLIEEIQQWMTMSVIPMFARVALLLVFITGMLAVMVSTANSYILIAVETWVRDLAPEVERAGHSEAEFGRHCVRRARRLGIILALLGCIPVAALVQAGIYLMGVIVVVFSVQVALAPASALALYRKDAAAKLAPVVAPATVVAFATAIAFGLWASYVASEWWNFYGVYLTSAIALGIPVIAISYGLIINGYGFSSVRGFLGKLFWPGP